MSCFKIVPPYKTMEGKPSVVRGGEGPAKINGAVVVGELQVNRERTSRRKLRRMEKRTEFSDTTSVSNGEGSGARKRRRDDSDSDEEMGGVGAPEKVELVDPRPRHKKELFKLVCELKAIREKRYV